LKSDEGEHLPFGVRKFTSPTGCWRLTYFNMGARLYYRES
jgi:hypothetical protein